MPEPVPRPAVDLTRVKPYADQLGDGIMQFSFTLPVPYGIAARRAAQELAVKMGLENPEVVHYQELTAGYTYFMMFGECTHAVDYTTLSDEGFDVEYMTEEEIESFARELVSSLQFYQGQPGSLGIGEIVITGGTAQLPGIAEELERLIGVHVRVGNPLARLKVAKRLTGTEQMGSLAVAIGLGIED